MYIEAYIIKLLDVQNYFLCVISLLTIYYI